MEQAKLIDFLEAEKDMPFPCGLELSTGGGRNTKRLMQHAHELHLVDFNQYAITLCPFRFMDRESRASCISMSTMAGHFR